MSSASPSPISTARPLISGPANTPRSIPWYNHHETVAVDHIDLIAGEVKGKVARYLADGTTLNPDYDNDRNDTTRVLASFTGRDWGNDATAAQGEEGSEGRVGDGWRTISYHLGRLDNDMYFRLRGTNLGRGVPNETDPEGNPLSDELMAPNTADKAYADLWFYSNPVFIRARP